MRSEKEAHKKKLIFSFMYVLNPIKGLHIDIQGPIQMSLHKNKLDMSWQLKFVTWTIKLILIDSFLCVRKMLEWNFEA